MKKGIIDLILNLHMEGLTNAQIISLGFAKGTVTRRVAEFKKQFVNA